MRRAADEIDRAVAQRLIALSPGKSARAKRRAPRAEEAELDGRDGREIGIRDQVRDGELHQRGPLCSFERAWRRVVARDVSSLLGHRTLDGARCREHRGIAMHEAGDLKAERQAFVLQHAAARSPGCRAARRAPYSSDRRSTAAPSARRAGAARLTQTSHSPASAS